MNIKQGNAVNFNSMRFIIWRKNILHVIYDNFHTLFNNPLPMQNFRANQYIHRGLYILSYFINASS